MADGIDSCINSTDAGDRWVENEDAEGEVDYDDEEDYVYEEADQQDDDDGAIIFAASGCRVESIARSDAFSNRFCGLRFEGVLSKVVATPYKNAVYPIYKQLAEFAAVDVEEHFLAALVTIPVKEQFIILQIEFPQVAPYFPDAPPRIELKSRFEAPLQHFNIVFNHHPQLLPHKWNICTDIVQIFRDIAEVGKQVTVELCDVDEDCSLYRQVVNIMRENCIDVTSLFPEAQFSCLPSFGIRREADTSVTKHSGVGYSGRGATTAWKFTSYASTKMENLLAIAATQQRPAPSDAATKGRSTDGKGSRDPIIVDCICYIMSALLSDTVTMEEFFRSLAFYDSVVSCLLALPLPSAHIPIPIGLFHVHSQISNLGDKFRSTLEGNELAAVQKLDSLCRYYRAAGKKRQLQGDDSAAESALQHLDSGAKSGAAIGCIGDVALLNASDAADVANVDVVDLTAKIVRMEAEFKRHLYHASMGSVGHLSSKWMRRLNIELASMPDSVPDNVIVFSGIECNQPNLMKVFMFPECEDTPYCGGCFEFDIFIGPNYPQEPPKMILVTTGGGSVRFNPNLYQCGKVCLSLLGTWQGEKWDPNISSLTQVINSILFLIFVEDPFFNEPGYEVDRGTERGNYMSREYNANIRIQTLRFGYLEHLKSPQAPFCDWVVPKLKHNWQSKGKRVAQSWLSELDNVQSTPPQHVRSSGSLISVAEQKRQLTQLIAKIDAAIQS